MARRGDAVFQLSLTEIAFTVVFVLLLLLGYLVFRERADAQAGASAAERARLLARETAAMEAARERLRATLAAAGVAHPDDVISRLVEAEDARVERDRLRQRVEDLDARLSALAEVRRELLAAGPASAASAAALQAEDAIVFRQRVRDEISHVATRAVNEGALAGARAVSSPMTAARADDAGGTTGGRPMSDREALAALHGELADAAAWRAQSAAGAADAGGGLRKDNADLRGQVAFLRQRLGAHGGRDFPPCWADAQGRVEFLFAVELRADEAVITPAWPARRDAEARALPGVQALIGAPVPLAEFSARVGPLRAWTRAQDPECRHYVQLRSTIADAVRSDRARLVVEGDFYKAEARR